MNIRNFWKSISACGSSTSKLYLADGYDMVRYYTEHMNIEEKKEKRERGILILYAMPDTKNYIFPRLRLMMWSGILFKRFRKQRILQLFIMDRKPEVRLENLLMNLGYCYLSISLKTECFSI